MSVTRRQVDRQMHDAESGDGENERVKAPRVWDRAELDAFCRSYIANRGVLTKVSDDLLGRSEGACADLYEQNKGFLWHADKMPIETAVEAFVGLMQDKQNTELKLNPSHGEPLKGAENGESKHDDDGGVKPNGEKRENGDVVMEDVVLAPLRSTAPADMEKKGSGDEARNSGQNGFELPAAGRAVGRRTPRKKNNQYSAVQTLQSLASGSQDTKKPSSAKLKKTPSKTNMNGGTSTQSKAHRSGQKTSGGKRKAAAAPAAEGNGQKATTATKRKRKRKLFGPEEDFTSLFVLCDASCVAQEAEQATRAKNGDGTYADDDNVPTPCGPSRAKGNKRSKKASNAKRGLLMDGASPSGRSNGRGGGAGGKGNDGTYDKVLKYWSGGKAVEYNEEVPARRRRKPVRARLSAPSRGTSLVDVIENERKAQMKQWQSDSISKRFIQCLSPAVRRWCTYEWFYAAIDRPWFLDNTELNGFIEHCGIVERRKTCTLGEGKEKQKQEEGKRSGNENGNGSDVREKVSLTRLEWAMVRQVMGRPRRLSKSFLRQERAKLENYRQNARKRYKNFFSKRNASNNNNTTNDNGNSNNNHQDLLKNLPPPVTVGQRVIAKHRKLNRQAANGLVLTAVQHQRFRIQFDEKDLGVEMVEDIDLMPLSTLPENGERGGGEGGVLQTNASQMHHQVAIPHSTLVSSDQAHMMQSNPAAAALHHLNMKAPTVRNDKNNSNNVYSMMADSSPSLPALCMPLGVPSQGEGGGGGGGVNPPSLQNGNNNSNGNDAHLLARLSSSLDRKEELVGKLRRMNDDAESGAQRREGGGGGGEGGNHYPAEFQYEYATTIAELPMCNKEIQDLVVEIHNREREVAQFNASMQKMFLQQAQMGMLPAFSAPNLHVPPDEVLKNTSHQASQIVEETLLQLLAASKRRDGTPLRDSASDLKNRSWDSPDGSSSSSSLVSPMVKQLVEACITAFLTIQVYAEHSIKPEDINDVLDKLHNLLKPRASANSSFYHTIGRVLNDVAVLLQPRPIGFTPFITKM